MEIQRVLNVNQQEFTQYLIQLNVIPIINVTKVYKRNYLVLKGNYSTQKNVNVMILNELIVEHEQLI